MNREGTQFEKKFQFDHKYPATKIMWSPELNPSTDLLVTSGETLKVWEVVNNQKAELKANLVGVRKADSDEKRAHRATDIVRLELQRPFNGHHLQYRHYLLYLGHSKGSH